MIDDVREFHQEMGLPVRSRPGWPSEKRVQLRIDLIDEEIDELFGGMLGKSYGDERDLVKTADAIADLIYVLIGTALELGIPMQEVWDAVHAANMRKKGGSMGENGKQLKPEGWKEPDVESIINKARGSLT